MTQKSLEELAAEHLLLTKQGAYDLNATTNHDMYLRVRRVYTEMLQRFGVHKTSTALYQAKQAYDLLVPKTEPVSSVWLAGANIDNQP